MHQAAFRGVQGRFGIGEIDLERVELELETDERELEIELTW